MVGIHGGTEDVSRVSHGGHPWEGGGCQEGQSWWASMGGRRVSGGSVKRLVMEVGGGWTTPFPCEMTSVS